MDTNVNEEVDMDLLVKDQPDIEEEYREEENKEVEKTDPDPDAVVKADLEMDPAAATESFIRKRFGLSREDLEEEANAQAEAGEELVENVEAVPVEDEDALLGVEPATDETVVTVTPPIGGDTVVTEDGGVPTEAADLTTDVITDTAPVEETVTEEVSVEPESSAEVAALENLRAIFSREDDEVSAPDADTGDSEDNPDVSLNVETPENNVDIDLDGKAVTIEPVEGEGGSDEGTADEVPAPETSDEGEESSDEEGGEEGSSEEESDNSAESWWFV